MQTIIKCQNCEEVTVFLENEKIKNCKYCHQPVLAETLKEATNYSPLALIKQRANLMQALSQGVSPNNKNVLNFSLGLFALASKTPLVAKEYFKKIVAEDSTNSESRYYYCLSLLNGKRPFLQPRQLIDEMIQYLDFAIATAPFGKYLYLKALLIFDFYKLKNLRYPENYQNLVSLAYKTGISKDEINEIFTTINMAKPANF